MAFESCTAIDHSQPVLITVKGGAAVPATLPSVELDLHKFPNGRWALQLDDAFARRKTPVVLIAEGVACLAVAWWAQLSPRSYLDAVSGAMFRSPLNIGFGQAPIAASARTGPTHLLPFPSIVVNDVTPYIEQVLALADRWGSRFVDAGAPLASRQSNRGGGGTGAEDMLLGYIDLLSGHGDSALYPTAADHLRIVQPVQG